MKLAFAAADPIYYFSLALPSLSLSPYPTFLFFFIDTFDEKWQSVREGEVRESERGRRDFEKFCPN